MRGFTNFLLVVGILACIAYLACIVRIGGPS